MIANLEWYRVFYWVAKEGSLSKAADALYITQPAVSYAVKQLETALGGKVFNRNARGVTLTAEGQILYKFIGQAYGFLSKAEQQIAEMQQLQRGKIRIGAGDTLSKHYLLPYLENFHKAYPQIKIHVTNRTSRETLLLLKDGKIDLGIVNLPIDGNDVDIDVIETLELQDCFVVGEKYKGLANRLVSYTELSQNPLILLEKGSSIRSFIDNFSQSHGITLHPEVELGSLELVAEFAKIGLGIAYLVKNFITEALQKSELYEIQLDVSVPARKVGIITLNTMPLSAASLQFLQLLCAKNDDFSTRND